ncbi:unnamed protein product [Orchesella dallaii]|uniref:Uncharacterized protein n=1 Tax=Orchesella dallaii TaxID=48710 RepID=A0ABP1RBQ8_9HEXA
MLRVHQRYEHRHPRSNVPLALTYQICPYSVAFLFLLLDVSSNGAPLFSEPAQGPYQHQLNIPVSQFSQEAAPPPFVPVSNRIMPVNQNQWERPNVQLPSGMPFIPINGGSRLENPAFPNGPGFNVPFNPVINSHGSPFYGATNPNTQFLNADQNQMLPLRNSPYPVPSSPLSQPYNPSSRIQAPMPFPNQYQGDLTPSQGISRSQQEFLPKRPAPQQQPYGYQRSLTQSYIPPRSPLDRSLSPGTMPGSSFQSQPDQLYYAKQGVDFPQNRQPCYQFPQNMQPSNQFQQIMQPSNQFQQNMQPSNQLQQNMQMSNQLPQNMQPSNQFQKNMQPSNQFPNNMQPSNQFQQNMQMPNQLPQNMPPQHHQFQEYIGRPSTNLHSQSSQFVPSERWGWSENSLDLPPLQRQRQTPIDMPPTVVRIPNQTPMPVSIEYAQLPPAYDPYQQPPPSFLGGDRTKTADVYENERGQQFYPERKIHPQGPSSDVQYPSPRQAARDFGQNAENHGAEQEIARDVSSFSNQGGRSADPRERAQQILDRLSSKSNHPEFTHPILDRARARGRVSSVQFSDRQADPVDYEHQEDVGHQSIANDGETNFFLNEPHNQKLPSFGLEEDAPPHPQVSNPQTIKVEPQPALINSEASGVGAVPKSVNAQVHHPIRHLPHRGGSVAYYNQDALDAHHKRLMSHTTTSEDKDFERDDVVLSWYKQMAEEVFSIPSSHIFL